MNYPFNLAYHLQHNYKNKISIFKYEKKKPTRNKPKKNNYVRQINRPTGHQLIETISKSTDEMTYFFISNQ